ATEALLLGKVAEEEGPDREKNQRRHDPRQQGADEVAIGRAPELDVILGEVRGELLLDASRYEIDLAVLERRFEFSLDPILMDQDLIDLPLLEEALELAIGDLLVGRCRRDVLEQ